ncbi:MAG: response regulator [Caulobacterales bacterium]
MRVLVVEDEALVAMLIEDMLEDMGHETAGTASQLGDALEMAQRMVVDLAIIDLNLNGQRTDEVARILSERGVPFVFATGYGAGGLSPEWAGSPTVQKPFQPHQLEDAIKKTLDRKSLT